MMCMVTPRKRCSSAVAATRTTIATCSGRRWVTVLACITVSILLIPPGCLLAGPASTNATNQGPLDRHDGRSFFRGPGTGRKGDAPCRRGGGLPAGQHPALWAERDGLGSLVARKSAGPRLRIAELRVMPRVIVVVF